MRRLGLSILLVGWGWLQLPLSLAAQARLHYDITAGNNEQREFLHDNISGSIWEHPQHASDQLFSELERLARLVDITYCVGTSGISKPFTCLSRCSDFPSLELVETWNTGVLMTDSCGYVALDHGRTGTGIDEGAATDTAIIVAFRGTYSITNTIVDLSTAPQEYVPYPGSDEGDGDGDGVQETCTGCTVHAGFLASWRSARRVVLPVLAAVKAQYPTYPIHLVGHSLGGAVAALAALELRLSRGWRDTTVTTFGEPRVGNAGLVAFIDRVFDLREKPEEDPRQLHGAGSTSGADLRNRKYRRLTHAEDPVPLLPLSEWGYRSHAGEIYIEKLALPPSPEDLIHCRGDSDPRCSAGGDGSGAGGGSLADRLRDLLRLREGSDMGLEDPSRLDHLHVEASTEASQTVIPTRLKLWQLFFAHRDYFWRLGLCVPGGDPVDWWREKPIPRLSRFGEL